MIFLFHAVVGTSRLPLTSVEAPLPAFSLGELAYIYRPDLHVAAAAPLRSHNDLIEHALLPELCWLEKAKLLETLLRATPWDRLTEAGEMWMTQWRNLRHTDEEVLALLRTLFNEVALSPYTDLVDKALAFVGEMEAKQRITAEAAIDFLGHLLRQLGRHLAYDRDLPPSSSTIRWLGRRPEGVFDRIERLRICFGTIGIQNRARQANTAARATPGLVAAVPLRRPSRAGRPHFRW